MLTVVDEYTRRSFTVKVAKSMRGAEVLEVLYNLVLQYGKPKYIRSDNAPEFISKVLKYWLERINIKPIHIYPGSPWENGFNERFNKTLRHGVLNAYWFDTIRQAQVTIND